MVIYDLTFSKALLTILSLLGLTFLASNSLQTWAMWLIILCMPCYLAITCKQRPFLWALMPNLTWLAVSSYCANSMQRYGSQLYWIDYIASTVIAITIVSGLIGVTIRWFDRSLKHAESGWTAPSALQHKAISMSPTVGRLIATLAIVAILASLAVLQYKRATSQLLSLWSKGDPSRISVRSVEALVRRGADVNARFQDTGDTILWIAASYDNLPCVRYLISRKANVNAKNAQGQSVLLEASRQGNYAILAYLTDRGGNVNSKDIFGDTPLADAAEAGKLDCVKYLVFKGADLNNRDRLGRSALQLATESGQAECAKFLSAHGAR